MKKEVYRSYWDCYRGDSGGIYYLTREEKN